MIWQHESEIDIDDAIVTVGWSIEGRYAPATWHDPAEYPDLDWEVLTPGIKLSPYDTVRIEDELWTLAEEMKDSAEEDAAESRAFDRAIDNDLYMERMR